MTGPEGEPSTDSLPEDIPSFLHHRLGAEEVVLLYRIVLGRPPESVEVIDRHIHTRVTITEFLNTLLASPEYQERQRDLANQEVVRRIDVTGSPEQMKRLMAHARQVWTELGDADPYWSVLTNDAFKQDRFDAGVEERFYTTGADDAAAMAALADEHGVDLPVGGRILDFGCGVGRVGQHLSKMFDSYVGVDISRTHLRIAADRFETLGQTNARFLTLPDFLDGKEMCDYVYSILVLQHNPPPVICYLFSRLLDSLRPGGVGFVQVPCATATYEFDLASYLDQMSPGTGMEMHAVPEYAMRDIIEAAGCRLLACHDDGRVTPRGRSRTFLFQKGSAT